MLAQNAADIVVLEEDGALDWMSSSVEAAFGCPPVDFVGLPVDGFIHPDDLAACADVLAAVTRGEDRVVRARATAPNGVTHWIEVQARLYIDHAGMPTGLISTYRVVEELMEVEATMEGRARTDLLTELPNRSEILRYLSGVSDRDADTRTGRNIGILFCDLDRFKDINDEHSHAAGDLVLRTLSERISSNRPCGRPYCPGMRGLDSYWAAGDLVNVRRQQRRREGAGAGIPPHLAGQWSDVGAHVEHRCHRAAPRCVH